MCLDHSSKVVVFLTITLLFTSGCSSNVKLSRTYETSAINSDESIAFSSTEVESTSVINLNLKVSLYDEFVVLDHGKNDASAYRVKCGCRPEEWAGNEIWTNSFISVDWCYGRTFSSFLEELPDDPSVLDNYVPDYSTLSYDHATKNILDFEVVTMDQIPDIQSLPSDVVAVSSGREVFAYHLNLDNYPWESEFSYTKKLEIPRATVYVLSACVDDIPCGITADCASIQMGLGLMSSEYPTFEWDGVMRPAGYYGPCSYRKQYTNGETIISVDDTIYEVLETLVDKREIVPVEECLKEVPQAITYDMSRYPCSTYEVYSAELRYIPLHEYPHPKDVYNGNRWVWEEGEEFILVPVWEFSMLVKREDALSEDSDKQLSRDMYRYTVYVNALTGKSIYSGNIGPADKRYWMFLYDSNV